MNTYRQLSGLRRGVAAYGKPKSGRIASLGNRDVPCGGCEMTRAGQGGSDVEVRDNGVQLVFSHGLWVVGGGCIIS